MPGVIPDSGPRAFQRQSYSRPPAFWISSLTLSSVPVSLPASLLEKRGLLAVSAPGRVSWMQDSDSGTTHCCCCHLQRMILCPSPSFMFLASPEGTAGGLKPVLSAAPSHCRPVVAMGEAGGAEAAVICLLPLGLAAAGLCVVKMGCFGSLFPSAVFLLRCPPGGAAQE